TSDTPSYVIDKNDMELLSLFGDSATATLIQSSNEDEKFIFGTDGSGYEQLIVRKSGTRFPASLDWIEETGLIHGKMEMQSTEIFTFAIKIVPSLIQQILEKHSMNIEDVDYFVFHQANSFLLEVLRKKLKIQKEKFFNDIILTGNTVSSSIPIALHTAEKKGTLRRGMKVLIAGFGIGLTWGGTIIKY
ncbi:MAG: 3-oxoacyl-ACP synthase III family protein, partial [Bacteroidota bacterium]